MDGLPKPRKESVRRYYLGLLRPGDLLYMPKEKLMLLRQVTLAHAAPIMT